MDAVLAGVDVLSREAARCARGSAVGELCTALRSYCALVTHARPPALRPEHLQTAIFAPLDALEAVFARSPPAAIDSAVDKQGRLEGPENIVRAGLMSVSASASRLEEVVVGTIFVTAGRVGVEDALVEGSRGGGGGRGGGTTAKGVAPEEGLRLCASALSRVVVRGIAREPSSSGVGGDPGQGSADGGSGSNVGGGSACCAGLYAALLLRASRFEALSEVVGGILGYSSSPLSGLDEMG